LDGWQWFVITQTRGFCHGELRALAGGPSENEDNGSTINTPVKRNKTMSTHPLKKERKRRRIKNKRLRHLKKLKKAWKIA
jgi:hypothetical protein